MNAQFIRNMIIAAHAIHDHIVHFYHLSALDWVGVFSALKANVWEASKLAQSLSPWPNNDIQELKAVKTNSLNSLHQDSLVSLQMVIGDIRQ